MEQVAKSAVIKVARKILKKSNGNDESEDAATAAAKSMNLKNLVEQTCKKMKDDNTTSTNQVKDWIQESNKFVVNGKKVSLKSKRKRKKEESIVTTCTTADVEKIQQRKRSKKTEEATKITTTTSDATTRTTTSTQSTTTEVISKWREEQKIMVVRNTVESSQKIRQDSTFSPFRSFDDCRGSIEPSLLRQCTQGNGFKIPSPIQAQAWPILNKGHDVVGIAEVSALVVVCCYCCCRSCLCACWLIVCLLICCAAAEQLFVNSYNYSYYFLPRRLEVGRR